MSSEGSLVGEFINNVDDSDWLHLAGQVSSEFQFLDQNWFLSWETKYLSFEYPNTHVKYLSITDINKKLQGVYPYMLISKFGLKILSSAGFYFPFRMILHSTKLTAPSSITVNRTLPFSSEASYPPSPVSYFE